MEWTGNIREICHWIKTYRYIWIILIIGILFMVIPEKREKQKSPQTSIHPETTSENLQEQLGQILSKLEGAGKVQVLLTESVGKQTIYEIQQEERKDTESLELRSEVIILKGADGGEYGLVSRIDPPQYLGAVVLCHGADSARIRLAIVDAVSAATGLGADKISVWKMK